MHTESVDRQPLVETGFSRAWICCFLALLLTGTAALAASFIPFHVLAAKVRGMSDSGQATFFDAGYYAAMQLRLRVIGIANLAAACLVFLLRARISQLAEQIAADAKALAGAIGTAARSLRKTTWGLLFLLTLLAGWFRFHFLFQPMRYDEAFTFLQYSSHPFYVGLSFYNFPNNHLFHTFLVRCSYLIFGNHPWALRLPVFVAGALLVPATCFAARALYGEESGLLAAGLVSASTVLIEFSTNARGYILVCLVFMILVALGAHALHTQNWAAWLLMGVIAALGFYTIPTMLYPFGGLLLWIVLCGFWQRDRSMFRETLLGVIFAGTVASALTLELYSPVFAVSGPQAVVGNKFVKSLTFPKFLHELPASFVSTWNQWNQDAPCALVILLAASCVGALILQRVVPFERVWTFALPLYFIAAGAGIAWILEIARKWIAPHYAAALLSVAIALTIGLRGRKSNSVYASNEGRGFDQIAAYLKPQLQQGDSVIAPFASEAPLRYYFQRQGVPASYINHAGATRFLIVVSQISDTDLHGALEAAHLPQLEAQPAHLLGTFDSAMLYEVEASR